MKTMLMFFRGPFIPYTLLWGQEDIFLREASPQGQYLYTVQFISDDLGCAKSRFGNILKTTNSGKNWELQSKHTDDCNSNTFNTDQLSGWRAEIYCVVMQSKDGGENWSQYDGEQDHFCGVYFKDENTGYKIAEEFLTKVVKRLNLHLKNIKKPGIKHIIKPKLCSVYYTNENDGWALGWCAKDMEIL